MDRPVHSRTDVNDQPAVAPTVADVAASPRGPARDVRALWLLTGAVTLLAVLGAWMLGSLVPLVCIPLMAGGMAALRRWGRRQVIHWGIYTAYLLLLGELASRIYLAYVCGVPFVQGGKHRLEAWYPELAAARTYVAPPGTRTVLILGGSVVSRDYHAAESLQAWLDQETGGSVRLLNMAYPGHTTRDSLYKYAELGDRPVDLVIVYHGINDTRPNNVPPGRWRDDYLHIAWYDTLGFYARHPGWCRSWSAMPLAAKEAQVEMRQLVLQDYLPKDQINVSKPEWLVYGQDIKSETSFRANLEAICDLAARRGQPLLLLTFAMARETGDAADSGETALARRDSVWGNLAAVTHGTEVHNRVTAAVAAERGIPCVDVHQLFGHDPADFTDICHFTPAGGDRFAKLVGPAICDELGLSASTVATPPDPD